MISSSSRSNSFDCDRLQIVDSLSDFPLTAYEAEDQADIDYYKGIDYIKKCETLVEDFNDEASSGGGSSGGGSSGGGSSGGGSSGGGSSGGGSSGGGSSGGASSNIFGSEFSSNSIRNNAESITATETNGYSGIRSIDAARGIDQSSGPNDPELSNGKDHQDLEDADNNTILKRQLQEKARLEKDPEKRKDIEDLINAL